MPARSIILLVVVAQGLVVGIKFELLRASDCVRSGLLLCSVGTGQWQGFSGLSVVVKRRPKRGVRTSKTDLLVHLPLSPWKTQQHAICF